VVEQVGRIRVVQNGVLLDDDFLDIRGAVLCCGERRLFSLVFPPDAATSNRFYVNFTRKPDGHTVVARFLRTADPLVADASSRFDLMWPDGRAFIEQPFFLAPAASPPNPGDGVEVGLRAFTSLAVGASLPTTISVAVPANLSQTSYLVSAVADADGQVTEIVEGALANGRVATTRIALVRPDLQVTRLATTAVSPAVARAARGGTLVLRNVTVKNAAAAPGYAPASRSSSISRTIPC
jgi:hypothetical protein